MIKKRLSLSLLALIGSVFLFVIASFAWFAVADIVDVGDNIMHIQDIDVSAELYMSSNGVDYIVASNIDFQNNVPGETVYYKVIVTNNSTVDLNVQVSLYGFTDGVADLLGDDTNYVAGRSLMDTILLSTSNSLNSDTITNQILTSLLNTSFNIVTHEYVALPVSGSGEFYFVFSIPSTIGNDYQNLKLDIDNLFVQSVG